MQYVTRWRMQLAMSWLRENELTLADVANRLAAGTLVSFANRYFRGGVVPLVAARKVGKPHGPIASKLWEALRGQISSAKAKRRRQVS